MAIKDQTKPALNRLEIVYCLFVVCVVAVLSFVFASQGIKRQITDEPTVVFWSRVFLGIWLIGLAMEIYYRRLRMNGIMTSCILVGLALWAFFGNAYFLIKEQS